MPLNLLQIVKSSRNITVLLLILIIIICTANFEPADISIKEKTDKYFLTEIRSTTEKLVSLKSSCQKKVSLKTLRQQFMASRYAYKKLAVLSEYFNIYETKFLNGPALKRVEDDTPETIIPPQGFQAIEEILFSSPTPGFHVQAGKLIDEMLVILNRMKSEPDRIYKFKDDLVWDAIRSAIIRLISLGITGFDSPIAQNSLPEARSSIIGIKKMVTLFKNNVDARQSKTMSILVGLLDRADTYLQIHNNFAGFDRLTFISSYLNPIYKQLSKIRIEAKVPVPDGLSPVNYTAESIFQEDFFNINFFSPGSEYWKTDTRIELGKKLFSDPILSGAKDRSCASCHLPEKAFTDGRAVPYALDNKTNLIRNTPTLWNSALQTRQFFDNRSDILENQLKQVVHDTSEMRGSLKESVAYLKKTWSMLTFSSKHTLKKTKQ